MTFLTHSLGGYEWQFETLTLLSYSNPIPVKRKSKTLTRNYTNFLSYHVIKTVFRQGSILTCHVVRFEVKVRKFNYIDSSWFEQLKLLLSGLREPFYKSFEDRVLTLQCRVHSSSTVEWFSTLVIFFYINNYADWMLLLLLLVLCVRDFENDF